MIERCGLYQNQHGVPLGLADLLVRAHSSVPLWSVEPGNEHTSTLTGAQRELISMKWS